MNLERFVEVASDGCWNWKRKKIRGYGNYRGRQATRVIWEELVGPIPEGLQLDHLCRNIACVNPAHLEPVTDLENKRRRFALVTHCVNGHPFDENNTYIKPSGQRDCRACIRERQRRCAERKRERGVA